jgi:hypothetical protein
VRWRPDRDPRSCTYAQLQEVVNYDLAEVLAVTATNHPQAAAGRPAQRRTR